MDLDAYERAEEISLSYERDNDLNRMADGSGQRVLARHPFLPHEVAADHTGPAERLGGPHGDGEDRRGTHRLERSSFSRFRGSEDVRNNSDSQPLTLRLSGVR